MVPIYIDMILLSMVPFALLTLSIFILVVSV
jgi:hypothetical protein